MKEELTAVRPVQPVAPWLGGKRILAKRIGERIAGFYQSSYPSIWEARRADIEETINSLREIYARTFFPDMRVDWRTYPENIGHMYSAGCMRCHDGQHVEHGQ